MEITFNAIGLEISNENAFNNLLVNADKEGEASRLARKIGVLHGKCWKLGLGLEVWTVLYESDTGDVFFADCRPGFRSRFTQKISPWILTEYTEDGEAMVHGFIESGETEVLFQLQNLTESSAFYLEKPFLNIGLCGLAYRAEVFADKQKTFWQQTDEVVLNISANENDWNLCGEILSFQKLANPYSGNDLCWIYVDLQGFKLEVLVNQKNLFGTELKIGAYLNAEVWLQGHIFNETRIMARYEGIDWKYSNADFWKNLRKLN